MFWPFFMNSLSVSHMVFSSFPKYYRWWLFHLIIPNEEATNWSRARWQKARWDKRCCNYNDMFSCTVWRLWELQFREKKKEVLLWCFEDLPNSIADIMVLVTSSIVPFPKKEKRESCKISYEINVGRKAYLGSAVRVSIYISVSLR